MSNDELMRLLAEAVAVIEDFLPNIGQCVLQDYGRLNRVLTETRRVLPNPKGETP